VPVERTTDAVGPAFASHAAERIEVAALRATSTPAAPLAIDLPGLSGQPAFAGDGRSLDVVQFFADTNHDGVCDDQEIADFMRSQKLIRAEDRKKVDVPEMVSDYKYDLRDEVLPQAAAYHTDDVAVADMQKLARVNDENRVELALLARHLGVRAP